ncbi:hypothetical protein GCM10011374_11770 [Kocuria dechangensis]|uniref:Uncharacterized protein n=1 Tax=Kocuria dechangensis TaxID=1176249 RepID=A0A917GLZ0_9MICC|nr:hypothetical protein [Kocuria dechangensis]GGG50802.1 hypothetical protein GCM10011374_11770 [Kocuria dechangensis]
MSGVFYPDEDHLFPYVLDFRAEHIKAMDHNDVRHFMAAPIPRDARHLYRQERK